MKKIKGMLFKGAVALYGLWLSGTYALAQEFEGFEQMANKASTGVKGLIRPIANVISWAMLFVSVPMLLWAFIKRGKNDGQSNDSLIAWGSGLLIGFGLLQVILYLTN